MKCLYCDSYISPYPANGLCPNCNAPLPPKQEPAYQPPVNPRPVFYPQPGLNCCGRCGSRAITAKKRGFRWIYGILGFLFLPPFGILFGLIGHNTLVCRCSACNHKWTRH